MKIQLSDPHQTTEKPLVNSNPSSATGRLSRIIHHEQFVGYAFALPFILGFLALTVFPMLVSLYLSFTDYDLVKVPRWVGLENYIHMFKDDPNYFRSIVVTFYYVFVSVPLKVGFALFVAFLLTRKSRMVSVYRSFYYLPSLIGGSVAVIMVWKELFAYKGVINTVISAIGTMLGFDMSNFIIKWFGDPNVAMIPLIILSVWQFGSSMIIFAAGLKQIPVTYYEAARIDGAGIVQQFFKITLPILSPVILFNLIMQTISGFMSFTQAYIISPTGGVGKSTFFYALNIYVNGFQYYKMGYASAMSWVLLIIIAVVTAVIFKTSRTWVFYESKD